MGHFDEGQGYFSLLYVMKDMVNLHTLGYFHHGRCITF
jgi:hypothetical protein